MPLVSALVLEVVLFPLAAVTSLGVWEIGVSETYKCPTSLHLALGV